MGERYQVVVGAGSLRRELGRPMPHAWTDMGVTFESDFTGAHLLHLSVAACVLNDVYREAGRLDMSLEGVRVVADGSYDTATWSSTGIEYAVEVEADLAESDVQRLLSVVDEVAEVPRALRAGVAVVRRTEACRWTAAVPATAATPGGQTRWRPRSTWPRRWTPSVRT